ILFVGAPTPTCIACRISYFEILFVGAPTPTCIACRISYFEILFVGAPLTPARLNRIKKACYKCVFNSFNYNM
ncbi:hypothetical protein, partial [Staphylococcus haemolyticus]|uniref:hypothetical protein n=2 Tax=Staphylococcus haemolyticus TaxID=1283 RepID=UPI0028868BEA